jgi:serine/threonine protein kinase
MNVLLLLCDLFNFLDEFGDFLGSGSFGTVEKAINIRTKREVAIKSMNIRAENHRKYAKREEENYKMLKGSSPYLVEFIESFEKVWTYILN